MYNNIEVYAGSNAARIIRDKGLDENDIKVIAGASGGPKFLILAGLDRIILQNWFKKRKDPLFFIGSSIGSWRGAAYACSKPLEKIEIFTESYMRQLYLTKPTKKYVTDESLRIINDFLDNGDIDYILNKSKISLNIISARCNGLSATENNAALALSFLPSAIMNVFSRNMLLKIYHRTLFTDSRHTPPFAETFNDSNIVPLSVKNLRDALLSSGSIPFVMQGIRNIDGAPVGTYRDGGLTDYHINIDFGVNDGIVLFPHFSSRVVPGWLDKIISWRKPDTQLFSNTLLVAPSEKFIKDLPLGKIPDRSDFTDFHGRDKERLANWNKVIQKSKAVGEEFMEAAASGKISKILKNF